MSEGGKERKGEGPTVGDSLGELVRASRLAGDVRSESVRGGDFLDAHRKRREGGRESESRNREGRGHGAMPGNDDWVLWRNGGRVGEERIARFLAGSRRQLWSVSGALQPDRNIQKKRLGWFCLRRGGCPRIMIQLLRAEPVPGESHSKQPL